MCLLSEGKNCVVEFDFGDSFGLASILFWNYNDKIHLEHGIKSADISIWNDQDGWKKIYDDYKFDEAEGSDDYDEPALIAFNNTTKAQKVRLDNLVSFSGAEQVGLSAIRFFEELGPAAVKPVPANGEVIGAMNSVDLKWTAGSGAEVHQVYVGTDEASLELLGKVKSSRACLENLQPDTTYYWRIDEAASDGAVTTGSVWNFNVEEAKIVGWWKLDELKDDAVVDSTGNTVNSKIYGEPILSEGKYGNCLQLDGIDDYVEAGTLNPNSNTITISAWVRRDGAQQDEAGIVMWNDEPNMKWWGLCFGEANELRYCWDDIPEAWQWDSELIVPDNQWVFVALTIEPTKATIFKYDSSIHSAVLPLDHPRAAFNKVLNIGRTLYGKDILFKGSIDDVRVYNYSLDQSQIEQVAKGSIGELPRTIGKLQLKETIKPQLQEGKEPAEEKQVKRSNNLLPVLVIVAVVTVIVVILGLGKKQRS
jgi:hypothetical protein